MKSWRKMDKEELKKSYFKSKKELDVLRDNATLEKWKILSKAYRTGKKIWGSRFTRERLSFDMDIPMTTTLRCLSLDRANKRSWDLIEEGKLSVFKLAMICQSKNITYQDEIIDMVIEDKLSTYQIKSLKVGDFKDINKERHRLACENGYSRESVAYRNFCNWVDRGTLFLLMSKENLPKKKAEEVKEKLKKLKRGIDRYIK